MRRGINVGPGGSVVIPVEVDYCRPFGPSDADAWEAEYKANIRACDWDFFPVGLVRDERNRVGSPYAAEALSEACVPEEWLEELEAMEPAERQLILDELAARYYSHEPDLWEAREVVYEL